MPVPFRDREDLASLGSAGFLKVEPCAEPSGFRAALFQVNARGEPEEFTYNRVEAPSTFLWRAADVKRAAARQLTVSLLQMCPRAPRLILCLAAEMPAEVFTEDIAVDLPVCRITRPAGDAAPAPSEAAEQIDHADGDEPLLLLWYPAPPAGGSPERALVQAIARHGLLIEPFERASAGLDELYGEADPRLS